MIKTIGFLGCGNMGGAIARAVCKAADPQNVYLANRTAAKAEALAAVLGCNTTTNAEVAGRSDLIFLAVKPQMMEALLAPLRFTLNERPSRFILCSMAAGLSIARIQEMAGEDYPVIRIMPNTPASVGAGMIQYCSANVTAEEEQEFLKLMAPAGRLDAVPEALIDAASSVSGCGPAWVYPVSSLKRWPMAAWPAACPGPRHRNTQPRWYWAAPSWCWKAENTPVSSRMRCAAPAAAPFRACACWKSTASAAR